LHDNERDAHARRVPFFASEDESVSKTRFRFVGACGGVLVLLLALSAAISPVRAAICNDAVMNRLIERASIDTARSLSADGTFVVVRGNGRVLSDTTATDDVYVVNRVTCGVELVSVATGGVQANTKAWISSISNDGRYVAFVSDATTLDTIDLDGWSNAYVHDRQTGITTRVSRATDGGAISSSVQYALISGDGRYVAFSTSADNVVTGDSNNSIDVFRYDRQTDTTVRVTLADDGLERGFTKALNDITPDGRYIAFTASANFAADDTNNQDDVYIRDLTANTTTRVSLNDDGTQSAVGSTGGVLSDDAQVVAFASSSTTLTADDNNIFEDIFVRDRAAGTTTRVSRNNLGAVTNNHSSFPRMSANGRYVVFQSSASNLIFGDSNVHSDIFIHDRQSVQTTRLSRGATSTPPNDFSRDATLSRDGRYVMFTSFASNLIPNDTNAAEDVFGGDLRLLSQFSILQNGDFSDPTIGNANTGWGTFATPDETFINARIQDGVLEFHRKSGGSSAVVLQNTGVPIPDRTTINAYMELGNNSPIRQRVLAMLHSADFSDLQVCTFWIEPGVNSSAYAIETHTTAAWIGASLSLYASPATDTGWIRVDNVEMEWNPGGTYNRTICYEPIAFGVEPLPDSLNLLDNGDFSTPSLSTPINGWGGFATAADGTPDLNFLAHQFSGGVFEFYRKAGGGSAVILQNSETAIPSFNAVEIVLQLGNSGGERKRLLIMMHDGDFSDLQICSFWIAPNTPPGQHIMISWTTEEWTNAHLSLYASPATNVGWIQVDNVVMRHRPALIPLGTECYGVGTMPIDIGRRLTRVPVIAPTLMPTATPAGFPSWSAPDMPSEQPLIITPTRESEATMGEGTQSE
jgi:hypothetical protein